MGGFALGVCDHTLIPLAAKWRDNVIHLHDDKCRITHGMAYASLVYDIPLMQQLCEVRSNNNTDDDDDDDDNDDHGHDHELDDDGEDAP